MCNSSKIWLLGGASFVVLILAVTLPMVGNAQERGWGRDWKPAPEEILCRLETRLDLTAEQKEKLVPIIGREMEKRHEMVDKHRQEMAKLRDQFHKQMDNERENSQKELASVLTDDQMKEFEKMTRERQERWGKRAFHGDRRGPGSCWR